MAVVYITGASSGLGEHLALELAQRGHDLGLLARREERLVDLASRIQAVGVRASLAVADVTDDAGLRTALRQLETALGPPEICVANAGVNGRFDVHAFDMERARYTFEVNVFGAMRTAAAVLPGMLERDSGHLVVISSVAANRGLPKSAPYSASKAAITAFWEGMRLDLAHTGVRCTTIHPGFVETPLTDQNEFHMPFKLKPDDAARRMADAIEGRRAHFTYPWQMRVLEKLMRVAPASVFDATFHKLGLR